MSITVFFDFTCPFCLLGWENLKPIVSNQPVAINWHPVVLDMNVRDGAVPFLEYHFNKYGSRSLPLQRHVEELGRAQGIAFDFARLRSYPSTFRAHRLVRFAQGAGKATEAVTTILEAYFLRGQEIQDIATLRGIAADIGLDAQQSHAALMDEALDELTIADTHRARNAGVMSVPSYSVSGVMAGGPEQVRQLLKLTPA